MVRFLISFSLLFTYAFASAQDANNLALDATIKDQDGGRLTGVSVVLLEDGTLVNKVKTGKNGRFDLLLDFDHEYIVEANKPGYVSKRMHVNTKNVPEDEQLWGYEYGGFAIDLFKKIEGVDFSILEQPVAKIYYDPNIQNFDYDKVYTKQIKRELDELIEDYKDKEKMQEQILKQKEQDYLLAMKDAENAMEDGDYLVAKENYLAASAIKPSAKEPKTKITSLEAKINAESGLEEKYLASLATADQLYGSKKYSQAEKKYKEASALKPSESYPIDQAKKSAKAATELKAKQDADALLAESDRKYNAEIENADEEFTTGNYQNARTHYQNALSFKSEEKYPKDQLAAIEKRITEEKEQKSLATKAAVTLEKYKAQIAKADAAFKSGNYASAKKGYEEAINIKADETYPKDQLDKIESELQAELLADEAKAESDRIQSEYTASIGKADKDYKAKNYDSAKSLYANALDLKPGETYPKTQIELIDSEIVANAQMEKLASAERNKQALYSSLMAEGKSSIDDKAFTDAITKFNEALEVKPNDAAALAAISQANNQIKEFESNAAYAQIIDVADKQFQAKEFDEARTSYQKAASSRPGDKYPKNQIALIEKEIVRLEREANDAELAAATQLQFKDAMTLASASFEQEDYASAIIQYEAALKIIPTESEPKNQIKLAKARIEEIASNEREAVNQAKQKAKYDDLISTADGQRDSESFDDARKTYNLAASVLPTESYPKEQIAAIDKLIEDRVAEKERNLAESEKAAKQAEIEAQYAKFIKSADGYMDQEDFLKAKAEYNKALEIKSSETYPKNQISAIEKVLGDLELASAKEEKDRNAYNNHLSAGDKAVMDKDWAAARSSFAAALGIYPDEVIPASRLKEIDGLEQKETDERLDAQFSSLVSKADQDFLKRNYAEAKAQYQEALSLKAGNSHCELRLKKIDEILAGKETETIAKEAATRSVTEENFQEGNAKVTIRTVVVGEKTDKYKRVIHSWGGKYYFLNDQPISELLWNTDTTNE
jgi:tetratricopeptide (TPR) repeat protein